MTPCGLCPPRRPVPSPVPQYRRHTSSSGLRPQLNFNHIQDWNEKNTGATSLTRRRRVCRASATPFLSHLNLSHYHISAFHFPPVTSGPSPRLACNLWFFLSASRSPRLPRSCTLSLSFSISQSLLYNQSVLNYSFASSLSAAFSRSHRGRR